VTFYEFYIRVQPCAIASSNGETCRSIRIVLSDDKSYICIDHVEKDRIASHIMTRNSGTLCRPANIDVVDIRERQSCETITDRSLVTRMNVISLPDVDC